MFLITLSFQELKAGNVRTVYSDNVTILPVNLRMGQSTILRFIEKPKKVVLGNSNYYSVEFIENDLAIQPLGVVTTNLFVYGAKNVYGFILKTNQSVGYDDLVQVDLKENKSNLQATLVDMSSRFKETSRPRLTFLIEKDLEVTLSRVQRFEGKDFYVIDFLIKNVSKVEIDLSKIEITLSRGKLKLLPQELILKETKLKSGELTEGRVFALINKKVDLSLEVYFKNTAFRQIIAGRFL